MFRKSYSNQFKAIVLLICLFAVFIKPTTQARILFLLSISAHSESHFYQPIVDELANKGHHVTLVSSAKTATNENVTELIPVHYSEYTYVIEDPFKMREENADMALDFDFNFMTIFCDKVYENKQFKELVLGKSFDLIITLPLQNQCFYGIIDKFKVPFVLVSSLPNFILRSLGSYNPTSFIPYHSSEFSNNMNFYERLCNFLIDTREILKNIYVNYPIQEAVYRKHLGENIPGIQEIESKASLLLMNSNFLTTYHRSNLPNVVEIGGVHCKPAKKLPNELEEFLSQDFILFSMGTSAKGVSLPESTRKIFVNVFAKLKERVLWKWESEQMDNLPSNVKLSKWIPQQDVLGHRNIKLFITHGGLLSSQQTIYHGVPTVVLPLFFDQRTNAEIAVQNGYGIKLDIFNITESQLENAITKILTDKRYSENVKHLSKVFKHQPQTPLERAIFWIEHVLRFDGAEHLKSPGRNLNYFQHHSLDVIFFLAAIAVTGALFVIFITSIILIKFCRTAQNKSNIKNSRKNK